MVATARIAAVYDAPAASYRLRSAGGKTRRSCYIVQEVLCLVLHFPRSALSRWEIWAPN